MMHKLTAMELVLAGMLTTVSVLRADDAAIEKDLKVIEGEWTVKSEGGGEISYKFKGNKPRSRPRVDRTR